MGFFFTHHVWHITALILICAGMAGAASAVVITESPSHVMRGEQITIDITGLSNNSAFSLLIEATLRITPGQDFLFETTNFVMPIALKDGQISATTTNTQRATYSAQKGTTEVSVTRSADANGVFSFSQAQSVPAGTFDFIRLEGTPQPDENTIVSSIQLRGKKSGPDSSHLSFAVNGIDNGRVQLIVYVDGSQALYQTVTIGEGITAVQTTPSASPTSGPVTVNGTATPTPVPVTNSPKTFFSADRTVSLTVERVDFAGLVAVKATGVPGNWTLLGDAYTIAPDSLTFSVPATISFGIPHNTDCGANYTCFIGQYRNSQWFFVNSTLRNSTIAAAIDRAGTFALMAYRNESMMAVSPSAAPAGSTIPAGTLTPASTLTTVSVVKETSPAPAATKAPLSILPVLGALAIGVGIAWGKRR